MELRLPLFRRNDRRSNVRMAFFENEPTGVLLRLPESMVTEDTEYIPFRTTLYEDPRVVEFVNFMLHVIVSATDGKVSPKSIWNEWLGRPQDSAIDRAEMKAGISFEHVQQLFTDVFDAGDRVRGRLNGEVQRVWEGFMLIPPRAEYTLRPAPAGTPATTAVPGRNLREDTDKADAESDKITLEVLYDGPTPAKFRYRFDDALMSVTMYLDKGSVAEPRRPRAYRISAEPIYE